MHRHFDLATISVDKARGLPTVSSPTPRWRRHAALRLWGLALSLSDR
jgi:hypothetical protein